VSAGTISNALTGKRPVAEGTRRRIMQAIDELGYEPNVLARSLVNRRSETLAVVASGLEFFGPSRRLVGIEQEANRLGYSLLLDLLHRPDDPDALPALGALTARRVDGIVWAVPEVGNNRAWLSPERLASLPPIVFLSMAPRPGVAMVASDNRAGGFDATAHLVAGGRRRIAMISGPLDWWEARERCEGYRAALVQAGIAPDSALCYEGDWLPESGEQGLRCLLECSPRIDAIFASNDQMALGALRVAHLAGLRVPDDLAVVGFDNMPQSAYFWPSLSTIRQQLVEVGGAAVAELHQAILARRNGEQREARTLLLSPTLIVRESSAPARN